MTPIELRKRTDPIAASIFGPVRMMPKDTAFVSRSPQKERSDPSVTANYISACIGNSNPDFISKLSIVEEEADEFNSIILASIKTSRRNQ